MTKEVPPQLDEFESIVTASTAPAVVMIDRELARQLVQYVRALEQDRNRYIRVLAQERERIDGSFW